MKFHEVVAKNICKKRDEQMFTRATPYTSNLLALFFQFNLFCFALKKKCSIRCHEIGILILNCTWLFFVVNEKKKKITDDSSISV